MKQLKWPNIKYKTKTKKCTGIDWEVSSLVLKYDETILVVANIGVSGSIKQCRAAWSNIRKRQGNLCKNFNKCLTTKTFIMSEK